MFAPCAYREADLATCELLSPSIRRGHEPAGDRVAVESGTFQRSLARPLLPPVYQLVLVVGSSGTENRRHKGSTWSVASCASSPGRESTNDALWISVGSRICQPSRPLPADTRTRSAVLYRGQCVLGWLGIGGSPLCARSLGLKEPPRHRCCSCRQWWGPKPFASAILRSYGLAAESQGAPRPAGR